MTIKVGINGFGRIGRMAFRAAAKDFTNIEIVAINDLLDPEYLAYMLKHDSVHGLFDGDVSVVDGNLVVNGKTIRITAERNPRFRMYRFLLNETILPSAFRCWREESSSICTFER